MRRARGQIDDPRKRIDHRTDDVGRISRLPRLATLNASHRHSRNIPEPILTVRREDDLATISRNVLGAEHLELWHLVDVWQPRKTTINEHLIEFVVCAEETLTLVEDHLVSDRYIAGDIEGDLVSDIDGIVRVFETCQKTVDNGETGSRLLALFISKFPLCRENFRQLIRPNLEGVPYSDDEVFCRNLHLITHINDRLLGTIRETDEGEYWRVPSSV